MERALVRYRVSDGFVIGTWRGRVRGDEDLPADTDPALESLEISLEQYETLASNGLRYGSEFRFKVVAEEVVEQSDPRPRLRFTPADLRVAVGSPPPTVAVALLDRAGRVVTTTGTLDVTILGSPVSLDLVSGVGSLTIPTVEAKAVTVGDGPDYSVERALQITVFSPNALRL